MLKFTNYFYLFSKLTTSFVLLLIIIAMGYLLFFTYQGVDNESSDVEYKFLSLSESIIQNNNKLLSIDKKLNNNDIVINEIKSLVLQENKNLSKLDYSQDIDRLSDIIEKLQDQISKLKLSQDFKKNEFNSNINKSDEINSLYKLILIRYKNGETIDNEILLLESLLPNNKKAVFEKLNLLQHNKFYGIENLVNELDVSIKKYSKINFKETHKNSPMLIFLSKFVSITPRNLEIYKNIDLNKIMLAQKYMELEEVKLSLDYILLVTNKDKIFIKWIEQAKIFLEFESTIKQVR